MGEKMDALEVFFPDRMASRILDMGDILSLVEKAQANLDEKKALEMQRKIRQQEFTLEDFLDQIQQVRSMGPLEELLSMIPGMGKQMKGLQGNLDEKEILKVEAIVRSMTPAERRDPAILNGSRKKRIAKGSGTRVQDVNRLLKQFEESRKLMKQFADMSSRKGRKGVLPPFKLF
jgi:signal recognition particle subunit SRP54